MLSPRLKQEIYKLWTKLWSGGLTNPITSIEQITYLLFLKQLEQVDKERMAKGFRSIYGSRRNCSLDHHSEFDFPNVNSVPPTWIKPMSSEDKYCVGHDSAKWSNIKKSQQKSSDLSKEISLYEHINKYVFPWLRQLSVILMETTPLEIDFQRDVLENFESLNHAPMEMASFHLPPDKPELLEFTISTIDGLFKQAGKRSANYDIMGDVFEYMLDEIRTSGKNGQFRTPRHIIRFMIELLKPQKGDRIVDPAAGTCGFLINSLLYLRQQETPEEDLRLLWDGTPLRAFGNTKNSGSKFQGSEFTAFENDQTMARIGWMNMTLHGIEDPNIIWRDSLSGRVKAEESGSYDFAFANPPYTGNIDKGDLSQTEGRFPKEKSGKQIITDKSELLFVWLILDLLKKGGKGAVIVPEGVLFGGTNAHRRLRQQLLFENKLEAVISLPSGVFQPYTGVKTSIIIFQKQDEPYEIGKIPLTDEVWFYEVQSDGYSLNTKRDEQPEENDLWDAKEKYECKIAESKDYYKPDFWDERWRELESRDLRTFPEIEEKFQEGELLGIQELFPELPTNPKQAEKKIISEQTPKIVGLFQIYWENARQSAIKNALTKNTGKQKKTVAQKVLDQYRRELSKLFVQEKYIKFEPTAKVYSNYAQKAFEFVDKELENEFLSKIPEVIAEIENTDSLRADANDNEEVNEKDRLERLNTASREKIADIVKQFAKLDGFDVKLRSFNLQTLKDFLPESNSWTAKVRVWRRNEEWESSDGKFKDSHDTDGNVRPQYIADINLFNDDKTVKAELLEMDCIESNDLNLSAGRYKPFTFSAESESNPEKIISELLDLEVRIQNGLTNLLAMVKTNK